jgi:hypothetical protein
LRYITGVVLLLATAFGALPLLAQDQRSMPEVLQFGLTKIQGPNILRHVKKLASDEFEGRAPGTRGEDLTVKYLAEQFKAVGAAPGNPNGTYTQNVPLVGYRTTPKIDLTADGNPIPFQFQDDFVHDYARLTPRVDIRSADVVFAGYGITAPQFGWDDYKDVDVKGKLVLVLSGEPSRSVAGDENKLDPSFFKGVVRTYYSTAEFKHEQARRRGAAGVLVITDHEKATTYSLFQTFAKLEGMSLRPGRNSYEMAIAGWVTAKAVGRIFAAASRDLSNAVKAAKLASFRPEAINVRAKISLQSKLRNFSS